jgi:hypothetical protein
MSGRALPFIGPLLAPLSLKNLVDWAFEFRPALSVAAGVAG